MGRPECCECDRPATHYEKDSDPRRHYCGRHAAKWARRGVQIRESLFGSLAKSVEREDASKPPTERRDLEASDG